MYCRAFHRSHADFVDRTMPERRMVEMYEHLDGCDTCARFDAVVRRGLMVARNLPSIQPSPGFLCRLQQRLERATVADRAAQGLTDAPAAAAQRASISA